MSVAMLKRKINKASLVISEKVKGIEGTKLDDDFVDMQKKISIINRAVAEILSKTTEYLQPNPAYRVKIGVLHTVWRARGHARASWYPHPEDLLGDCMLRHGRELGQDSAFGVALKEVGESMKLMAEVKDSFDLNVKETFINPLQIVYDEDLREIGHHLKKLEGRRLDYDYKKKREGKIPKEDVRQALEKFVESEDLARRSMFNFLENDVEQVSQLAQFIGAALDYHKQCADILQALQRKLRARISAAVTLPARDFQLRRCTNELSVCTPNPLAKPKEPRTGVHVLLDQPCCYGLYDFEPQNQGELGFKEGDVITLTRQLDENWYEGTLRGASGFFPMNYVHVIVPLAQ